jgi:hypothetical protein
MVALLLYNSVQDGIPSFMMVHLCTFWVLRFFCPGFAEVIMDKMTKNDEPETFSIMRNN